MFDMFDFFLVMLWILMLVGCVAECSGCVFLVGTFIFVIGFIVTHI